MPRRGPRAASQKYLPPPPALAMMESQRPTPLCGALRRHRGVLSALALAHARDPGPVAAQESGMQMQAPWWPVRSAAGAFPPDPFPAPLTVAGAGALFARMCRPWFQRQLRLPVDPDPQLDARLADAAATEIAQLFAYSRVPGLGLLALAAWWPEGSRRHDQVRALCRRDALALQAADLRREEPMARLLQTLHEHGIPAAPYKGPQLAERIGLPPGLRPAGDRDLWIRPESFDAAVAALEPAGCRPESDDPAVLDFMRTVAHDFHLLHPDIGLIELHTRAYADMAPGSFDAIWARLRPGRFLDAPVLSFDANDLYVLLCTHLFLQGWTRGLKWLVDLLPFHAALAALATDALSPGSAGGGAGGGSGVWVPTAGLTGLSLPRVAAAAIETEVAFPVLAVQALLGHLTAHRLPSFADAPLRAALTAREAHALARIEAPDGLALSADWMVYQARRARRHGGHTQERRRGVWVHPGRVALELQIRSDAPGFWRRRLVWTVRRFCRGLLAAFGAPSCAHAAAHQSIAAAPTLRPLDPLPPPADSTL